MTSECIRCKLLLPLSDLGLCAQCAKAEQRGKDKGGLCAYCGKARATTVDHVIPQSLAKKQRNPHQGQCSCKLCDSRRPAIPEYLLVTVPACGPCNWRKGTRRLVPPSWEPRIELLNELLPGTPWRTWDGSPLSPAFREVAI